MGVVGRRPRLHRPNRSLSPVHRTLLAFVQNRARWPVILGLLSAVGVLAVIMNGTDLPFSTPTIEEHSGGLRILDMQLSYSSEEANQLFDALGTDGRRAYLTLHLLPDMLFPISYSLAFACTAAWFMVRLLPREHPLQWLSLTPLISGAADVCENLSLVVVNLSFPNRIDWLARIASVLTMIKWGLMPIGVVLLSVMVVVWFARGRPEPNVKERSP